MIAYFDTSALIPLLIEEPGSRRAGRVWDVAEHVASVRLIYTEARAALAQAARLGRLAPADLPRTLEGLEELYGQLDLLEVDDLLVRRAGELAQLHALRGYDAIHLAAAERVRGETTILVAGDGDLCVAAGTLGLAVADTSADDGTA
ncbi:MAG: type II toxin-antitoxin system VapC family toxin [Nitriliruptor sp.]